MKRMKAKRWLEAATVYLGMYWILMWQWLFRVDRRLEPVRVRAVSPPRRRP